jgi:uncharacterized protein involved in response to NO
MISSIRPPSDPYRLFFPLGIFLGLSGVAIWPLVYLGALHGYWGMSHAFIQSDGFLFSFIAGFLLTALPRFTSTKVPSVAAQWTLAALIIAGSVALELQKYRIGQTIFFFAYDTLAILAFGRFIARKSTPPETFSLIGIGILTGVAGAAINALATWGVVYDRWGLAGKRALTEGMMLLLVLGVGGFLGPRLLGFDKLPVVRISGANPPTRTRMFPRSSRPLFGIAGIFIALTIPLEYGFAIEWMSVFRASVATVVLAATVQPWRLPQQRTTLSWCVWTANILILVGLWMSSLFPVYRIDFLHILFIGGFTLLILAVGMRVTLSHGGHGLIAERKSWPLRIGLVMGSISMLARVGAPFSPGSYYEHLAIAGIFWIIALAVWGWGILRLIFNTNTNAAGK